MQIVIDIQESVIEHLKDGSFGARIEDRAALIDAVMNGTLLPDNATNGDVIRALFPDGSQVKGAGIYVMNDNKSNISYDFDWWNAPYKVGDTDGNS